MTDARLQSPAASRNRVPLLEVLAGLLPERARVLELAAGSGEHALHFARAMPGWDWLPSDPQPRARASIAAWRDALGPPNLRSPLDLDVFGDWPEGGFEAVVAINLLHIAPWDVTATLMARAARYLEPEGVLFLYGPYRRGGRHTSDSNAAFDADLRARDPRWGIRDLEAVTAEAEGHGLRLERVVQMPANNLSLAWRRP
ncbi:DUF938 domain-containing protein [Halomonas maura]|uniref:DUF938 domain-containing protein n=1 Tax=Halomonas maura TaxID=117606 RepID=UPI0025B387EF|nr:DUF938 domain-containing protein [Halomonas maura]MDN3557860.1 DUF938 domain-containing protein [Halomonas maura]